MPSGGARGRSGPAPDPNALRRDRPGDAEQWLTLPLAGRPGAPPKWPLSTPDKRELELWKSEWRRPQAVIWERNGQQVEVALYVRAVATAEQPRATAAARGLVVRMQETLGISLTGLARNKWRIESKAEQAATARTGQTKRVAPVRKSSRTRLLKVVREPDDEDATDDAAD